MIYDTTPMRRDFTPTGIKMEGTYENDRNLVFSALYKDIIKEVYAVSDVICAHHLTYVRSERRIDGFEYQIVQEIPSADTLIFDHEVAKKLWGEDAYITVLRLLASEPPETRDSLLSDLYYGRQK